VNFGQNDYKKAILQYQKLEAISHVPVLMARMAFCFQKTDKPQEAILLYNNLLDSDSSNAFLYFQLADCYKQLEDYKTATRKITIAHLLNRNNPTYLDSLISLYQQRNWQFRALDFLPNYQIQRTDDQVKITAASKPWIAFASCKAVWAHEPEYAETMNYISSEDPRIIEEKECLFNALLAYERLEPTEKIDFPGLYTLSHALPDKRVNDFIMYEISLRKYPEIISQLSQNRLEQLIDYVYTYRVKRMEVSQ